MSTRGEHLVRADRGFATGGGALARLISPAFDRVLDEIDRSIECGGLQVSLPDGSERRIGFRAPGPNAIVEIGRWMALARLATSGSVGWYKAWTLGEWASPDPVAIFELFSANAVPLGNIGRAKGVFRWVNALAHRLRDNAPEKARANIAAHYDLGNDFYLAWLDETMTYSSARFASPQDSLEDAQRRKIALLLDRLELKPGQRLLEIGCGWGSLAIEAAKRGANVVGLTLSKEQGAGADMGETRGLPLRLCRNSEALAQALRRCGRPRRTRRLRRGIPQPLALLPYVLRRRLPRRRNRRRAGDDGEGLGLHPHLFTGR